MWVAQSNAFIPPQTQAYTLCDTVFATRAHVHHSQVGAAAVWGVKCQGGCGEPVAPLNTSVPLYGDDFEINLKMNYAAVSCGMPHTLLNELLRTAGRAAAS